MILLLTPQSTGPFNVVGNSGTGSQQSTTCQSGCSTTDDHGGDDLSYGNNFNYNNGGIFATQWTSDGVQIWFWADGVDAVPSDVQGANPDPSGWGPPVASFTGASSVDGILADGKIVFDTNFCGNLVESLWKQSSCYNKNSAPTCAAYIANGQNDYSSV